MSDTPETPPEPETIFTADGEWKSYQLRVNRIHAKIDKGLATSKEERSILADYKTACLLDKFPVHAVTCEPLPPILYGYNEASLAFNFSRNQLYSLRAAGSLAFAGNLIFTATLAKDIKENPNPPPVPLNTIHTGSKGKLNPKIKDAIIKALKFCPVLSIVAKAHGLTPATLANWRTKGEQGDKKYVDFFIESEAAIAESQMGLVKDLITDEDWRAKAKVLEYSDAAAFGRNTLEVTGKDGVPISSSAPPPMTIILNGIPAHSYNAPPEAGQ